MAGLALILGIDRFMLESRALTNLKRNGVTTIVVAKWTGDFDAERLRVQLGGATDAAMEDLPAVRGEPEHHLPPAESSGNRE